MKLLRGQLVLFFLLFTLFKLAAQEYTPINHSDKWLNGKEWSIDDKNDIKVKIIIENARNNHIHVKLALENNSNHDVNIDPAKFYYIIRKLGVDVEEDLFDEDKNTDTDDDISIADVNKTKFYALPPKLFINKSKVLTGVGIIFDVNSAWLSQGFSKTDYLKSILLYKNTIEPNTKFQKIAIFKSFSLVNEIEFHLNISGEDYLFSFNRNIDDK